MEDMDKVRAELGAWKEAVVEHCIIAHIGWDDANPRESVGKLLDWHVQMALDPAISGEARALQDTYAGEVDQLRRELEVSQAETASWKSAHADMAKRNAILRDRHDLPVDRIMAHDHLIQAQGEVERLRRAVIEQGNILTGVANALKGDPGTDASHSVHDLAELAELAVDQGASAIATQARRSTLGDVIFMRAVRPTLEELDDYLAAEYNALPDAAQAKAEAYDDYTLIMKQGDLLRGVANALKGPPAPLSGHSVHDLPEVAATRVAELEMQKRFVESNIEAIAGMRADLARVEEELAQCHELAKVRSKEITRLTMKAGMLETRAERAETETLSAIGELAAMKFSLVAPPADRMTDIKAQEIMIREGYKKAGYILQAPTGSKAVMVALVHMGAVRWMSSDELRAIIKPGE